MPFWTKLRQRVRCDVGAAYEGRFVATVTYCDNFWVITVTYRDIIQFGHLIAITFPPNTGTKKTSNQNHRNNAMGFFVVMRNIMVHQPDTIMEFLEGHCGTGFLPKARERETLWLYTLDRLFPSLREIASRTLEALEEIP
jgi:hypothetical protein